MAPPFAQKPSKFSQMSAAASRARTSKADISRDLDIARGRKEFFSNRPDVSDDRALRRMTQADETQRFKNLYTKPVAGSSNLLQMTADAPRSLADNRMLLANQLGPTPREILGDMAFAGGSILQNLAQKGTPLMNFAKSVGSGVQNFFTNTLPSMVPEPLMQNINKGLGAFDNFMQSGQNFNMLLMALPPRQRRIYDREIMKPGMTRENAYRIAKGMRQMSMGGVASL